MVITGSNNSINQMLEVLVEEVMEVDKVVRGLEEEAFSMYNVLIVKSMVIPNLIAGIIKTVNRIRIEVMIMVLPLKLTELNQNMEAYLWFIMV